MPNKIEIIGPDLRHFTLYARDSSDFSSASISDLVGDLVQFAYNPLGYKAEAVSASLLLDGNPAFRLPTDVSLESLDIPDEVVIIVDWGVGGGGGLTALEFIGGAIASGIVGNAAYDLLRAAIDALGERQDKAKEPIEEALAKAAIRHQFARLSWELPVAAKLQVRTKQEAERNGEKVWTIEITCNSPEFSSTVIVPHPDIQDLGILVALRKVKD